MQKHLIPTFYYKLVIISITFLGCNIPSGNLERSPNDEERSFQFADSDLRISLVASEPDIISPVAMAWAADGAMFVVEMPGYPITENTGQIKRLSDPDGDGRYHLESLFATNLNFPTSVMPYMNGILVADAPNILFLKDTDGDGLSDTREVILTGFEPGNEQLRANALQWGLDNWIYGANGRSGGTLRYADSSTEINIDNRDFRFNPLERTIEAISGMSQYGLAMDNWGNRFISYNHRFARQVILEQKHIERNPSLSINAIFDTGQNEHDRRVYTRLKEAMRFNRDPIGYFTSLSGLTTYRGNLLGSSYEGDFFAGESVQAAVIRRRMKQKGVSFTAIDAEEEAEFLTSDDDWFHPVNFSNGPDGALYMVDFYRKFVEHPEWANENLREGVNWKEGENHGRIWRIAHKDSSWNASSMNPSLDKASIEELVQQLASPSGWRRDMAQQLLVERKQKEAGSYLENMLTSESPLARAHVLWVLEGLDLLTETQLAKALNDDHPQVLIQAINLAEIRLEVSKKLRQRLGELAESTDQHIRFQAILALGAVDAPSVRAGLIRCAGEYNDSWTRIALLSSTASWAGDFSKALLAQDRYKEEKDSDALTFFQRVGEMVASTSIDQKTQNWIYGLCKQRNPHTISELAFLSGYLSSSTRLGKTLPTFSEPFFNQALKLAHDESNILSAQIGIEILTFSNSEEILKQVLQLVSEAKSDDIKFASIKAVSSKNRADISDKLFANIQNLTPAERKVLISSSLGSYASALSLLSAIEQKQIDQTEIPEELRYALLSHTNEELKQKANEILAAAVNADRQAIVDHYLAALENQTVNLTEGASIFSQYCSTCHAMNGIGGLLAPDLTNIGSRLDEVLLVSILDPSRMVSYELRLHIIETHTGEVFSGTLAAETLSSITIKQPDGREQTILKDNIKKRTVTGQSIMPEGFERMIDEKGMADLIGFLRQPNVVSN